MDASHAKNQSTSEWQHYWHLPLVAALGYSAMGLHNYPLGAFMAPLQREFGWSRAAVYSGIAIANLGAGVLSTVTGALIDRWGPRRLALIGTLLMPASIALLSTATGSLVNWAILWGCVAFGMSWIAPTVWTSAVVSRFDAARGMAIAITLSGPSIGALLFPPLSTWLIHLYGWRHAYVGMGAIWALVFYPLLFLFFHDNLGSAVDAPARPRIANPTSRGVSLSEGLRMPGLYALMLAGICFAFTTVGIVAHLVPLLIDRGAAPMTAATIASLIGLFSIAGRLGTGLLLDRFPAHIVGATTFLLPVPGCVMWSTNASGLVSDIVATAGFGLTLGAEVNIITFLAMRQFGLRHFGVLAGAIFGGVAFGGALGPLAAGATYDRVGSYTPFLEVTIALMALSAVALHSLRRAPTVS